MQCGARTELQEPQPSPGCPRQNGYFNPPEPELCGEYVECVSGVATPGMSSPLPLVQVQRGSALIGPELQSVATPDSLCHKESARRVQSPSTALCLLLAGSLWHRKEEVASMHWQDIIGALMP